VVQAESAGDPNFVKQAHYRKFLPARGDEAYAQSTGRLARQIGRFGEQGLAFYKTKVFGPIFP